MIRLNAFFELKDGVSVEQLTTITNELVEKSLQDEGCKGYGLFRAQHRHKCLCSVNRGKMMSACKNIPTPHTSRRLFHRLAI